MAVRGSVSGEVYFISVRASSPSFFRLARQRRLMVFFLQVVYLSVEEGVPYFPVVGDGVGESKSQAGYGIIGQGVVEG